MRARAPIVPVAVVGAEEAAPIFAHVPALNWLTGLIYFPITPTFPHFGLLGMLGYLPATFHIRFLPPVPTDDMGEAPWTDKGLVQRVSDELCETIQAEVLDMVGRRRSVWLPLVGDFAARHPDVTVTDLRFANGLGPDLRTSWSRLFVLPVVPMILGFDQRLQFIHEDDIVGCLEHAVRHDVDGVHNCAPTACSR
jgi:hypothetical protein